jgi:hypothetical protein
LAGAAQARGSHGEGHHGGGHHGSRGDYGMLGGAGGKGADPFGGKGGAGLGGGGLTVKDPSAMTDFTAAPKLGGAASTYAIPSARSAPARPARHGRRTHYG